MRSGVENTLCHESSIDEPREAEDSSCMQSEQFANQQNDQVHGADVGMQKNGTVFGVGPERKQVQFSRPGQFHLQIHVSCQQKVVFALMRHVELMAVTCRHLMKIRKIYACRADGLVAHA